MTARVSIGMPIYNAERWLRQTVESLLAQTFEDFELIVSDNASSDGSLAILAELARRDRRITLLRQSVNIGANGNYSAVLAAARADLFKWASCNDLCAPAFLERCVNALREQPDAVLAYPRTIVFEDSVADGQPYAHDFALTSDDSVARLIGVFSNLRLNNPMNGVIRRDALARSLRMGNFRGADVILMAELALRGKYVLVDEPLFLRRMSAQAATSSRSEAEADRHLVPTATRPLLWQHWRFQMRLVRVVSRAAPTGQAWLRALRYWLQTTLWARRRLLADVRLALSQVVDRVGI